MTSTASSQPEVFVSKAIPALFHRSPEEFISYLTRDGNKFLRFYWDKAGTDAQVTERVAPAGLNYDIRLPYANTTVALVVLPRPRMAPEAYFLALVYRPLRRTPFLGVSDVTKVVSLEMVEGDQPAGTERPKTLLREWTRKMVGEVIGDGPEPRLEAFYTAVLELVKPE